MKNEDIILFRVRFERKFIKKLDCCEKKSFSYIILGRMLLFKNGDRVGHRKFLLLTI